MHIQVCEAQVGVGDVGLEDDIEGPGLLPVHFQVGDVKLKMVLMMMV